jgi:hypothetical protein
MVVTAVDGVFVGVGGGERGEMEVEMNRHFSCPVLLILQNKKQRTPSPTAKLAAKTS